MIKRIYSNGDCKVDLSEFKDIIDSSVSIKVVFFVNSASVNVEKNSLNEDYTVNLVWDELQPLGRGVLQYILYYGNSDTAFADGEYNSSEIRTTNYFIMSDIQITDDVTTNVNMSEMLQEQIDELKRNSPIVWNLPITISNEHYDAETKSITYDATCDFSGKTYNDFITALNDTTKPFKINIYNEESNFELTCTYKELIPQNHYAVGYFIAVVLVGVSIATLTLAIKYQNNAFSVEDFTLKANSFQ